MVNGNRITGRGGVVQPVTPLEYCNVALGLNFESSPYPLKNTSFVSDSSPYHHHHHFHRASETFADEVMMRASGKMLFTSNQWQELEIQTVIYKYIMASIPVPSQLLLPLSTQSNRMSMGLRFSNGSDPEPWRCRRTDGKKWRCSKDAAPDQKYCERHARKTRSRSRKPVETQSHNTKDYPTILSVGNRQTECNNQWFMKNDGTPVYQSNNRFDQQPNGGSKRDQILKKECSLTLSMKSGGNEMEFDHESFQMAVGMLSGDKGGCEDVFKPGYHCLNQASWAYSGSGSGSTPGGPLGEALRLGITSTRTESSSRGCCGSSCDSGGLNSVNRHDD